LIGKSLSHQITIVNSCRICPRINRLFRPRRHRHGSHFVSFSDNIHNGSASIALLDVRNGKSCRFRSPQSTADQHRKNSSVAHTSQSFHIRRIELLLWSTKNKNKNKIKISNQLSLVVTTV
jgi:hypothetical protein